MPPRMTRRGRGCAWNAIVYSWLSRSGRGTEGGGGRSHAGRSWGETTAEPRPNAYAPQDAKSLGVPKPYGRYAPFKPTEMGSNMRHIRKPEPREIVI